MADIILHHYETSPYAEKVRVAFGIKGLAWSSVQIPRIMPKPDLMPLTGGYRKTPGMQVGADIFFDTQLILRAIDALPVEPPLNPHARVGDARAWWSPGSAGKGAAPLGVFSRWGAWAERMTAIGHGRRSELSPQRALEIAKAATPAAAPAAADVSDPAGRKPGQKVKVTPDDVGKDPVTGELVRSSAQEIVIKRTDPQVGDVHVHFPRAGFVVAPA